MGCSPAAGQTDRQATEPGLLLKKSLSFNISFLGANLFFLALCVSQLVQEVQSMKEVALQEEEHPISPSPIRNSLVQLNDLSHFF